MFGGLTIVVVSTGPGQQALFTLLESLAELPNPRSGGNQASFILGSAQRAKPKTPPLWPFALQ